MQLLVDGFFCWVMKIGILFFGPLLIGRRGGRRPGWLKICIVDWEFDPSVSCRFGQDPPPLERKGGLYLVIIFDLGLDPSVSCRFGQDPPPLERRRGLHLVMILDYEVAEGRGGFFVHFLCLSKANEPKPACRQTGKGHPTRGIFPPLTENRFQNSASNKFSCLSELLSSMLRFGV